LTVRAYDPTRPSPERLTVDVTLCESEIEACRGSDVLAVMTEWENFRWIEPSEVAPLVSKKIVIDSRNLLDRSLWRAAGFTYLGVGR